MDSVGVGVPDDPQTKNSRDVKSMQNYYYNDAKNNISTVNNFMGCRGRQPLQEAKP